MTVLLRFDGLAVARGDRVLLKNLTGDLKAGEVLHLRGANGVGKTSLLEVLCGLRDPEAGEVRRSFEEDGCHWVGHRNAQNPAMTPAENLEFWCDLNEASHDKVSDALEGFGLGRIANRPCRQLSAGQQRRSALARLAVCHRDVWFLDEPLSALDQPGVEHWFELLGKHQARGGAAIVTSHQALPPGIADLRVWELKR